MTNQNPQEEHKNAVSRIAAKVYEIVSDRKERERFDAAIDKMCKMSEESLEGLKKCLTDEHLKEHTKKMKRIDEEREKLGIEIGELCRKASAAPETQTENYPTLFKDNDRQREELLAEKEKLSQGLRPFCPDDWPYSDFIEIKRYGVKVKVENGGSCWLTTGLPPYPPLWFDFLVHSDTQRNSKLDEILMCDRFLLSVIHDYDREGLRGFIPLLPKQSGGEHFKLKEFCKDIWLYYSDPDQRPSLFFYRLASAEQKLDLLKNALNRVQADLASKKPEETKQNVTPAKCWGIIKRIPGWIFKKTSHFILTVIGAVIVTIVVDIFADFGWLQSIKAFIYSILWPK